VCTNLSAKEKLEILQIHDSSTGGHAGIMHTYGIPQIILSDFGSQLAAT
jgi:hypothetical protein